MNNNTYRYLKAFNSKNIDHKIKLLKNKKLSIKINLLYNILIYIYKINFYKPNTEQK